MDEDIKNSFEYIEPKHDYLEIFSHIKKKIADGVFSPGQIIPSENELSTCYNVKRFVVRKVINKLIAEGLVFVIRNEGYYVQDEIINVRIRKHSNYTQSMIDRKLTPQIKIIGINTVYPDQEQMKLFSLSKTDLVWDIYVLRYYKRIPYFIGRSFIPQNRFPDFGPDFQKSKSIHKVFNKLYGIKPMRTNSICRATISDKKESRYLAIFENSPILKVTSINTDQFDKPVEQCISTFRSDIVRINVTI
jgi:GntR family transcriptional regulator